MDQTQLVVEAGEMRWYVRIGKLLPSNSASRPGRRPRSGFPFRSSRLALLEARRDAAAGAQPGVIVIFVDAYATLAKLNDRRPFAERDQSLKMAERNSIARRSLFLA
jgi:hypothetical protein